MKKTPPGGNGKGSGVSKSSKHPYNTPADSPQTAAADWPSVLELPAKYPAQKDVIVLKGHKI